MKFEPSRLVEQFRWKNDDGTLHTATSSTSGSEDGGKLFDTGISLPTGFLHPL